MKIGIINLSGNVGKSTLAVHLLAAFNPKAKIISVESINASTAETVENLDVEQLSASRFKEIFRELMINDDVIVDVGASNVAGFMTEITRFKSAVGEFDLVIVPTVPADKQQKDTIATIEWLNKLGLSPKKIRTVFNQYGTATLEQVELAYSQVVGYLMTEGKDKAIYEPLVVIPHNEIYEMVKTTGKTIKALAEDQTDWKSKRAEAKKAADMAALEKAMEGQMAHDLAVTAQESLALAYSTLFPVKAAKK